MRATVAAVLVAAVAVCVLSLGASVEGGKWPLRAPHRDSVPPTFDCAMRKLAYAYGKKLLPRVSRRDPGSHTEGGRERERRGKVCLCVICVCV